MPAIGATQAFSYFAQFRYNYIMQIAIYKKIQKNFKKVLDILLIVRYIIGTVNHTKHLKNKKQKILKKYWHTINSML